MGRRRRDAALVPGDGLGYRVSRWWEESLGEYLRFALEVGYDPLGDVLCADAGLPLTLIFSTSLSGVTWKLLITGLKRAFRKIRGPSRTTVMVQAVDAIKDLTIGGAGKQSTFILTPTSLYVRREGDSKWPEIAAPLRHVVWAEVANGTMEVSLLAKRKKKDNLVLVHLTGPVAESETDAVADFTRVLMDAAYQGAKRNRHLLVLVNPRAGPGKGVSIFKKKAEPLFKAARCTIEVTYTTHPKHAQEIAQSLPLDKYDAVVAMSGDGLIHEILNGFALHDDPINALRTPIAPVPTGSGNGLSLNLLGLQEGFDVSAATLNAIKGYPMPTDVFSVTQKDTRVLSFMSQAIGLMAELDLGTEHLRFMGDARFVYGYIRGMVQRRNCPVKVSIKVAESDKHKMISDLHAARTETRNRIKASEPHPRDQPGINANGNGNGAKRSSLPPLRYRDEPRGDGWIVFDKPILYLYAGKGPFVSRDLMQFPVSHPDDGFIDVVIQENASRKEMINAMDGAEEGKNYWLETQRYFKAEAYRVEPQSSTSYLSVDGECYPFEPYEVEVHKGLATLLSPYGAYNVDFGTPKTK